jgi:hypothetical protein
MAEITKTTETQNQIKATMDIMEMWGCLSDLNDREKKDLEFRLKQIATLAIKEYHQAITEQQFAMRIEISEL